MQECLLLAEVNSVLPDTEAYCKKLVIITTESSQLCQSVIRIVTVVVIVVGVVHVDGETRVPTQHTHWASAPVENSALDSARYASGFTFPLQDIDAQEVPEAAAVSADAEKWVCVCS